MVAGREVTEEIIEGAMAKLCSIYFYSNRLLAPARHHAKVFHKI